MRYLDKKSAKKAYKQTGKLYKGVQNAQIENLSNSEKQAFKKALRKEVESRGIKNANEVTNVLYKAKYENFSKADRKLFDSVNGSEIIDKVGNAESLQEATEKKIENNYGKLHETKVRTQVKRSDMELGGSFDADVSDRISDDGKTRTVKGQEITIDKNDPYVVSDDGKTYLNTSEGKMLLENISFGTENEALMYEAFADMNPNIANLAIRNYGGSVPVRTYVNGMRQGINVYGKYNFKGVGIDISKSSYLADLSQTDQQYALKLGRQLADIEATSKQKAVERPSTTAKNTKQQKKGTVRFEKGVSAKNDIQKKGVEFAKQLSNVTGVNIVFFDSKQDAKHKGDNGWFDKRDNSIHIDINAGNNYEGTIAYTLGHELTHFIEKWSSAKYKEFSDFLIEQYGAHGKSVEDMLEAKMAELNTDDVDYAMSELVADACETMLLDSNVMETLALLKEQNKTLWDKVREFFHNLLNDIRNMYKGYEPNSSEAQALREMEDVVGRLSSMFEEAAVDATKNYNASNVEVTSSNTNDIQYQLKGVDKNGIEIYETSQEVKGLSYTQRKAKLLDLMRNEYAGRTAKFTKNGQVYYAQYDERGIRKGIYGDKKSSTKGYKAKINIGADGNYIELAENALYKGTSKEQGKSNRFHANARTWDYFVKRIKSDGQLYDVLINVKDTGNNHYVYDITLNEAGSLPNPRRSYTGSSPASGVSISQNQQNATGNIQHSLKAFEKDGRRFVEIDQEQDRFDGHDRSEYPRIAKDIINEKFNGKVIGLDNKMFVNGRGRDEYVNPRKHIKENYIYDAKMRASAELDNLLDAGTNFRNEADGRDGHTHEKVVGGFDYFDTLFKVGDNYFEAVINIENIKNGKLFKDVTKIKDVTEDIMNSYGQSPKFQFLRTSSNDIISQNQQNATGNIQHSIKTTKDGMKYVDVDTDQMLFDKLDAPNKRAMAKLVIQEYFPAGTLIDFEGEEFYVSNRTAKEYAYAEKNSGKKRIQQDKMRAARELDNLLKASNFVENNSPDEVKGKHPEAIGGIDKYHTIFKVQNRLYSGVVNIINRAEGREIYDVTKIRSIGANEVLNNKSDLASQPDALDDIILQEYQKATGNIQKSLKKDSNGNTLSENKNMDNLNPTMNKDIRYSRRLAEKDLDNYLNAGNRKNISKEKALKAGKKIILTTENEIAQFIEDSIEGKNKNGTVAYGIVNDRLAEDVKRYSDGRIKIDNNFLELVPYDIFHAYKEHLIAKEKGDINLSIDDFKNIPQYIDYYDDLVYAIKYKSGNTRVCLSKRVDNGRVLIIETVSKSRGSLEFKNIIGVSDEKYVEKYENVYIKESRTNTRGSENSNISLRDESASMNSVLQDKVESQEQYSKRTLSNREILANALESTIDTSTQVGQNEAKYLADYKAKSAELDILQEHLQEVSAELKELSFAKGKRDMSKIRELRDEKIRTQKRRLWG